MGKKGVSITLVENEKEAELIQGMSEFGMKVEPISLDDMETVEKKMNEDLKWIVCCSEFKKQKNRMERSCDYDLYSHCFEGVRGEMEACPLLNLGMKQCNEIDSRD